MDAALLHVAPEGLANGDGSAARPFPTIAHAQVAVRARLASAAGLPAGGMAVEIHGGCYPLTQGLVFDAADSGRPGAPVEYRAAAGETVRILGGIRIAASAFTPVADAAVLGRLSPAVRERVMQVDLHALGIDDAGALASRGFSRPITPAHLELFFNDQPMTPAQWPDAGQFLTISGFGEPVTNEWQGQSGKLTGGFMVDDDRPTRWAPSDDIWVHGYWAYDWANSYERVSRLDTAARRVQTAAPHGLYYFNKGQRFYFLNVLEELDQPGEYYVDRRRNLLYFLPPGPMDNAEILVSVRNEPLLSCAGASHLTFQGLTFEGGRGSAIVIAGGEGIRIGGGTVRNCGNWAVRVEGGRNHAIEGCEIYGVGDGGISLAGGDRQTLAPCGHAVRHCRIHHYARWSRCYVPAVIAQGVGMHIACNRIHDAPHNAILFTGNDMVIENNEIFRVCLETGDAGAIYTGRDYTFRGNIVRRNFIHDMGGMGMGSIGIYMDDCVSGTQITENILWRCQYGILLGGGRDFVVANNIFVECNPAIHADARGIDPNPVWRRMVTEYMRRQLDAVPYREAPYRARYPEIADLDAHYAAGHGVPPENNRVERNICWQCPVWISETWPKGASNGIAARDNLVGEDPRFENPEAMDGRLRPDSPALALGVRPIPFETIGPGAANGA